MLFYDKMSTVGPFIFWKQIDEQGVAFDLHNVYEPKDCQLSAWPPTERHPTNFQMANIHFNKETK